MLTLHSAVGTQLIPGQTISKSNTGLWAFSAVRKDSLQSTLTFDRSLSTGHLQPHDDESHQNENGACLHVGLWCGAGADPSPNLYSVSPERRVRQEAVEQEVYQTEALQKVSSEVLIYCSTSQLVS